MQSTSCKLCSYVFADVANFLLTNKLLWRHNTLLETNQRPTMGTRSRIATANADGTFTSIYCHWDGYPSGVGVMLKDHYQDAEKVVALMSQGDRSSLAEGVTPGYREARGETGVDAITSPNFEALQDLTQGAGGEYLYVFKGGHWFCAKGGKSFFGAPADKAPEFLELIDEVLRQEAQASQAGSARA